MGDPTNRDLQPAKKLEFDPTGKNIRQATNTQCTHPEGGKNKICTECVAQRTAFKAAKTKERKAYAARILEYDAAEKERYRLQKKFEKADREAFYAAADIRANEVKSICFANPDIEILGAECCKDHSSFKGELKIDYVREIFDSAFENLGQAFIDKFEENPVTKLHGSVFRNSGLTGNIELPSTLVLLGDECFRATKLKEVTISHAIADQGNNIFARNSSLTKLTLQEGVEKIGAGMFRECGKLGPELNFPASITDLGPQSFYKCENLEKVSFLGNNDLVIGFNAFLNCFSLKELSFGSGVKEIGSTSFVGSNIQGNLDIPDACNFIGNSAFNGAINGAAVTFPQNSFGIGSRAFMDAKMTNSLLDLRKAIDIGKSAFEDVKYPNDTATVDLRGISGKIIRSNAFRNLPRYKATIYIDSTITSWDGTGHLKPVGTTSKYKRGDNEINRKVSAIFTSGLLGEHFGGVHYFSPAEEVLGGETFYSTTHYISDEEWGDEQSGFTKYGYIKYNDLGNRWELFWDSGVGNGDGYYTAYSNPVHPQDSVTQGFMSYASQNDWLPNQEYGNDDFDVITYKGVNYNVDKGVLGINETPIDDESGVLHPSVSIWVPVVDDFNDDIGGEGTIIIPKVENGMRDHHLIGLGSYSTFPTSAYFRSKTHFCGEINLRTDDIPPL